MWRRTVPLTVLLAALALVRVDATLVVRNMTLTNNAGSTSTPSGTITATLAGSCIFVYEGGVAIGPPVSIADDQSNSYIHVTGAQIENSNSPNQWGDAWVMPNAAAGVTTVTVTNTGSAADTFIAIAEVTGCATSTPVDTQNTNQGNGTGPPNSGGSVTTTNANDIVFSLYITSRNIQSVASPFDTNMQHNNAATYAAGVSYAIVSSTGTYDPTWTDDTAGVFVGSTVALKAAAGGPGTYPPGIINTPIRCCILPKSPGAQ